MRARRTSGRPRSSGKPYAMYPASTATQKPRSLLAAPGGGGGLEETREREAHRRGVGRGHGGGRAAERGLGSSPSRSEDPTVQWPGDARKQRKVR